MAISYDSSKLPEQDPQMAGVAEASRLHRVVVACMESVSPGGETGSMQFIALTPFVPRVGEVIQVEDGGYFEVKSVIYKTLTHDGITFLGPNVFAVRSKKTV